MGKPTKPKKLKLPKKPKASAGISVMENYLKRVKEIEKENAKRESDYKSDLKKWASLKGKIKNI
jgi:hypothetical protein